MLEEGYPKDIQAHLTVTALLEKDTKENTLVTGGMMKMATAKIQDTKFLLLRTWGILPLPTQKNAL
ncbi:MAG: hypothetical protein GY920_18175 [Aliivibrio sp.]|nr:hypothetical protein [Aliivibrio sp.]